MSEPVWFHPVCGKLDEHCAEWPTHKAIDLLKVYEAALEIKKHFDSPRYNPGILVGQAHALVSALEAEK